MTKEKLKEEYIKTIVSRAVEISPHGVLVLFDFFYSKLQEIREEDKRVLVEKITQLGNNREHRDLIKEVLDIVEQHNIDLKQDETI